MAKKRNYSFPSNFACAITFDDCFQGQSDYIRGKPNCMICEVRKEAPKDIDEIIKKIAEETKEEYLQAQTKYEERLKEKERK